MLGRMGFQDVKDEAMAEVLELQARYRDEFPVTANLVYLNHAAVGPLCRRAAEAMRDFADQACRLGSLHYDKWMECYAGLRSATARLIGAQASEIAIVKNTSEGIATVALGLDWKPGDRVVAFQEEFPANYYPWLRLEARGVAIEWLSIYDSLETIAAAVEGARLLAISYVNYLSGYRVDLEAIGRLCQAHGCFYFVDAIQGMGCFPIDVEAAHIDALAADGHKWMLGPEGNGVLYVRSEWLDRIEPVEFGWTNPANYNDYASRDMTLRRDAGRYECGTLNTIGCFGHRAALELLLEVGVDTMTPVIDTLARQVEDGARRLGYELMRERSRETGSGIVSFRHPGVSNHVIVRELKHNGITAAPRQGWIRMSPHFYNSPEGLRRALEVLGRF